MTPGKQLERGYIQSQKGHYSFTGDDVEFLAVNYPERPDLHISLDKWHNSDRLLISPLLIASKDECELAVEELLVLGFKPDAFALNTAIYHRLSPNLIKRLAQECTDINATDYNSEKQRSHSQIVVAAIMEDLDLVKVFIDIGFNVNAGCLEDREDMLRCLITNRRLDIIDILLESGLDVTHTSPNRDFPPLWHAASLGYLNIMRHLLAYGADPNSHKATMSGRTALEAAATVGRLDAVQLLLESGTITKDHGQIQYISAVHHTTQRGFSAVAELLKSHREWTTTDWHFLRWLEGQDTRNLIYVYHDQCTRGYITKLLKLRKESETIVTVCSHANIQIMKRYGETAEVIETVFSLETGSTIMTVENRSSADRCRNWLLIPDPPQNATDVLIHLSEDQVVPSDAISVSNGQSEEDIGTLCVIPDTCLRSGDTEDLPINIDLETHDEVEVDEETRQHILDDMLGVREAPIEPIEWSW